MNNGLSVDAYKNNNSLKTEIWQVGPPCGTWWKSAFFSATVIMFR